MQSQRVCGSPHREPGVVDQDVDVADVRGETGDARGVVEVGRHEVGAAALRLDFLDGVRTRAASRPCTVTVRTVMCELKGDRATEA